MATITTRAGKGSPLTNTEVDDNFSNLNSAKYESGSSATFASVYIDQANYNTTLGGNAISFDRDGTSYIDQTGTDGKIQIRLGSGHAQRLNIESGQVVFNEQSHDVDFRVESNDHTHALFVDASRNMVAVDTSDPDYLLDVGNGTSSPAGGKVMRINSSGDTIFTLAKQTSDLFSIRNNSTIYTAISSNNSAGLMLGYGTGSAGAINDHMYFAAGETSVNNVGANRDFRVESDGNANMLFVDAGNDRVGVGHNPTYQFDVAGTGRFSNLLRVDQPIWSTASNKYYTHLASGGLYNSQGVVILTTSIPGHSTSGNGNMFSVHITGYCYNSKGPLDFWVGLYSGENNFYSHYAHGVMPPEWHNKIHVYTDSNGAVAFQFGENLTSLESCEIAASEFVQGFGNISTAYARDWAFTTVTTLPTTQANKTRMSEYAYQNSYLYVSKGAVFNDASHDSDFRVESDSNANMLVVDANTNGVGIGKIPHADYALDVDGQILQNGRTVNGIVYNHSTFVSRPLNDPERWYKIYSYAGASSRIVKLRLHHGGDNTHFEGEFTVTLAGYGFKHSINCENYQYYNGPQIKEIATRIVSNTTLEIWVKTDPLTAYAGTFAVYANDSNIITPAAASEPTGLNTRLSRTHFPGSDRPSMAVSNHLHVANESHVKVFRSDDTRSGSLFHNNSGTVLRTNNAGDNLYLQAGGTGNVYLQPTTNGYATIVNEDSNDVDFRVETDVNGHGFFVDAGAGTANINYSIGAKPANAGGVQLQIGNTSSAAQIYFDGTTTDKGSVAGGLNDDFAVFTQTGAGAFSQRLKIKNNGYRVVNGVQEYYKTLFMRGNAVYTFDVDVKVTNGTGGIYEVFAGFTHYGTSYAAVLKQIIAHRSNIQSDVVIVDTITNRNPATAGEWSVSYVDADTIRLTKSAGTHGGLGYGYILVRGHE